MSHSAKRQYLIAIKDRYQKASRSEKRFILDEFCAVCGYHRKHAIRLLTRPILVRLKRPGPQVRYSEEVVQHLVALWNAMGQICSQRLRAGLCEWLEYYQHSDLSDAIRRDLLAMSAATIDRKLSGHRKKLKGISTTRRSKWWYKCRIPVHTENIDEREPGFILADTVAHCGDNAGGNFANTLTVTDLGSTWTENRAVWTKTQESIKCAMQDIENHLPFSVNAFKSDSGTEFINQTLYKHFIERPRPVMFFRTRPYHKNDNCHVEQKNFTHVRVLFGYERIDHQHLIEMMNKIYQDIWNPLHNFFIPSFKLEEKVRDGAKIIKKFQSPRTPYQRLMESQTLTPTEKERLETLKKAANPFTLRLELEAKLTEFKNELALLKITAA